MQKEIKNTLIHLQKGKTILYPTDTVWGLGCDVFSEKAVKRIYQIKQRKDSKTLIILVSSIEMLKKYVDVNDETIKLSDNKRSTTIIYNKTKNLPHYLLATDGSIAIRIVKDEFCKQLISQLNNPIVSTSANISGEPTPQIYREIDKTILHDVDYVVNWRQEDETIVLPSKIIKIIDNGNYQIIRE